MAEKGLSFLLKAEDSVGGGTYTTVAGMRTTAMTINGETVDITSKDSTGQWRELLDGAGVVSMQISASGVFVDNSNLLAMRADVITREVDRKYELVFESGDKYTGKFQVATCNQGGEYNGEVTYDVTLESNGVVTLS